MDHQKFEVQCHDDGDDWSEIEARDAEHAVRKFRVHADVEYAWDDKSGD